MADSANVKYRDVRYIVPFIAQLGLYISPVGFSSSIVPDHYRLLLFPEPDGGCNRRFRWALLGGASHIYWPGFCLSLVVVAVLITSGIAFFRKTEKKLQTSYERYRHKS